MRRSIYLLDFSLRATCFLGNVSTYYTQATLIWWNDCAR